MIIKQFDRIGKKTLIRTRDDVEISSNKKANRLFRGRFVPIRLILRSNVIHCFQQFTNIFSHHNSSLTRRRCYFINSVSDRKINPVDGVYNDGDYDSRENSPKRSIVEKIDNFDCFRSSVCFSGRDLKTNNTRNSKPRRVIRIYRIPFTVCRSVSDGILYFANSVLLDNRHCNKTRFIVFNGNWKQLKLYACTSRKQPKPNELDTFDNDLVGQ